ncbi:GDSL-type esterase/lipase family protein [Nonomuraea sp. NBC_01738]|uniref:GDSL-type esterase/lipase family protein n=1 Tax=Nonomuraea sp. NBC_01738 TaxID=2976003 RepID=UPI002E0FE7E7|nr:GDSL-type esterase/lipase family protein [Nonomuraea sp. NBC_01738]
MIAAVLAVVVVGSSVQPVGVPVVMAALGDSISAGFNACGWYVTCESRSWSTGADRGVNSHYARLGMRGGNRNFAVPGATSADLRGQVDRAVGARADYVTILIGAQDVCVGTERAMTPVPVFEKRVRDAFGALRAGLPGARVLVSSIPDLRRLWQAGKDNAIARTFWTIGRICRPMLADPSSVARADVERRARVRGRVVEFNRVLARVCAEFGPRCRTDGGAVFRYPFTLDHISKWDFFHPNEAGQRVLAERTFSSGFDWADGR